MKKRSFKLILGLFILGAGTSVWSAVKAQGKHIKHPNIILFLVDDMGWQETSVPFYKDTTDLNRKYHTPNMAKLAAIGTKFIQAYATPVCTPSRVSLFTGMNAARHRVTNWINFYTNDPPDFPYPDIKFPRWNYNGLSPIPNIPSTVYAVTFPEILKKHQYYTIFVGKGHLASYPTLGSDPYNLGFDINIAGSAVGRPRSYLGRENYGNKVKGGYTPGAVSDLGLYHGKDIFLTEALTKEAIKAMDNARYLRRPFFLYMSQYAVHSAYKPDSRFYQSYIDKGMNKQEAMYAALIQGMDKSLGVIMNYLKRNHLFKNTIILFMSDNGGLALVPPRGGKPFTQNLPLKSGKGSIYEGGIREPMIVYWPGVTNPGSTCKQYVMIEDFFPTILQMAGINHYKTVQKIDGKSFAHYLEYPSLEDTSRVLIWHYPNNWAEGYKIAEKYGIQVESEGMGPASALRQGAWKLIYFYGPQRYELYNLRDDIGEHHNLVKRYPKKVKKLSQLLIQHLKNEHAQFPTDSLTGEIEYPLSIK